jgi:hypothetical protein
MKRYTMNMTLAVAALTLTAGTISAQTMKAEIPFAFRVGKQVMQPGAYLVNILPSSSGAQIVRLANRDAKQSVLLVPSARFDVPRAWTSEARPKLRFACSEGPCTLNSMWMGEGSALQFHSQRGKNGEPRIAEITLRPERAAD